MTDMTPSGQQDLAAMNARVYAMSAEDQKRWYEEHPLSMYTPEPAVLLMNLTSESDAAILLAAEGVLLRRFGALNCHNERLVLKAAAQRIQQATKSPV